jgi:hypothetical protein
MTNWMLKLLKRGGLAVLGVVVCIVWWSIRGGGGGGGEVVDGIPAKIWEGGAATMTIDVETSCPARLNLTCSRWRADNEDEEESIECWQQIDAGTHSWTIDIPATGGGYIDLTAEEPPVGARLRWTVRVNDMVVAEETQTLDQPLEPNYAFGLQVFMDDYAQATVD